MKKKLLLALTATLIMTSLVGCNNEDKTAKSEDKAPVEADMLDEESNVGKWNFQYTKDEIDTINKEIITRVEEKTKEFGLKYEKEDKVTTEKERPVKEQYIYTDNLKPDPNKLESMYYAYKIYEEDLSLGKLVMKVGFNLDIDQIKQDGKFDFESTSLGAYSEAFINDTNRDYSELNKQIFDIINGTSTVNQIENNIEGLKETVLISDNVLIYILETKEYNLKSK